MRPALRLRAPPAALLLALLLPLLAASQEDPPESVEAAPPDLPAYDQPPVPEDGYQWTPGYWAWSDDDQDYYWVPGTWVMAPEPGMLWTPGYWGVGGAVFLWHPGYWGPHVGYYGGVDYGCGYSGHGFAGGYWRGGHFFYNRSVTNTGNARLPFVSGPAIHDDIAHRRVSYAGGGGIQRARDAAELAAARESHLPPASSQLAHERAARANPSLHLSDNAGVPPVAATARPGALSGAGVIGARRGGGTFSVVSAGDGAANRGSAAARPNDLRPDDARTGTRARTRPPSSTRSGTGTMRPGPQTSPLDGLPLYGLPLYSRPQRPPSPPAGVSPRTESPLRPERGSQRPPPPARPARGESQPPERPPERMPARMPERP